MQNVQPKKKAERFSREIRNLNNTISETQCAAKQDYDNSTSENNTLNTKITSLNNDIKRHNTTINETRTKGQTETTTMKSEIRNLSNTVSEP